MIKYFIVVVTGNAENGIIFKEIWYEFIKSRNKELLLNIQLRKLTVSQNIKIQIFVI
jgi:hypothetical protein